MRRASLMMKCMLLSLRVEGRSQTHHLLNQNIEYIVQVVPGPVYWSSLIAGIEHWQPPAIFGNLRTSSEIFWKFSENVRGRSSGLRDNLKNLRKSLEGGRKSSENHQKRRHQYVYIIKRILHVSSKI